MVRRHGSVNNKYTKFGEFVWDAVGTIKKNPAGLAGFFMRCGD